VIGRRDWGRFKRGIAGGLLAAGIGLGAAAPAAAETLTDALIWAYKTSALLDQNRALLRAADEGVPQALAGLRPVIRFVATAGYAEPRPITDNLTTSVALTADLTLIDFGRTRFAVDAAKETVLATRQALIQVEQSVLLNAVAAYMSVIRASEFVRLRQNNVRLITQELRAAEDRFDVGEVTRTDVAIAQSRLAGARAGLVAAEGDLNVARENYNAVVGRYPGRLVRPPAPPLTADTVDGAKDIAVRGHPAIRQAQHEVTVAELNIGRAEAALKPSLSGNLTARRTQDSTRTDLSTTLTLSVPIYSGGSLSAALRAAIAQRDGARAALLQTTTDVAFAVGRAWSDLLVAQASTVANAEQVRAARVAYNGVREEATLGARTTLDVLDAEQDLLDARAALIEAETQQYVAVYTLLSAMGLLTVEHLNLGIATYDPSAYYNAVRDGTVRAVSPQGEKLDLILKRLLPN